MKKLITTILAVIILLTCVIPAYAATPPEAPLNSEDFTLEEMLDAWQRRDMEQLTTYYEALYTPVAKEAPDSPTIAPRWQSGGPFYDESKMCHQKLTFYGFLLYVSTMQNNFGYSLSEIGFTLNDLERLMTFSEKPDVEENDLFTYVGHFYDPDTGENFLFNTQNTAKTNTANHYAKAIYYHNNNLRPEGLKELGRSLHYLQDINEPHHASNKTVLNSNHKEFEAFVTPLVDDLVEQFKVTDIRGFYDGYLTRSVSESAHDAAVFAKDFIGLATDTSANKDTYWRLAAVFTVGGSITCTSALIYRFARETHRI